MMLLCDFTPSFLRWSVCSENAYTTHSLEYADEWSRVLLQALENDEIPEAVGLLLRNGGDLFSQPVTKVSEVVLEKLRGLTRLLPDSIPFVADVAEFLLERVPTVPVYMVCDTAFFVHLPREVREYALPYETSRQGIRRYGGSGLCHEHVWSLARGLKGTPVDKIVSVHLSDQTTLAAIKNGVAVETTAGLTSLEGIVSARGCGEIDPTIIFQLGTDGVPYSGINRLLSEASGLTALVGRPCTLKDIADESSDSAVRGARRIFLYQVQKAIGAMLASLGGMDVLVFSADDPKEMFPLMREVCEALEFLGVRCASDYDAVGPSMELSPRDSTVRVLATEYDQWRIMYAHIRAATLEGGITQ